MCQQIVCVPFQHSVSLIRCGIVHESHLQSFGGKRAWARPLVPVNTHCSAWHGTLASKKPRQFLCILLRTSLTGHCYGTMLVAPLGLQLKNSLENSNSSSLLDGPHHPEPREIFVLLEMPLTCVS